MNYFSVINLTQDKILATKVRKADSKKKKLIGLLDRTELKSEEGMYFEKTKCIHSFFMKFAFDCIYLDKDFLVVKIVNMYPFQISWALNAIHVLELPINTKIKKGDKLNITRNSSNN